MTENVSALIVKYSCVCGLERVGCAVPLREKDEDILRWMEKVTALLQKDHARRSPNCHPDTLKEVLIPIADGKAKADRIGDAIPTLSTSE